MQILEEVKTFVRSNSLLYAPLAAGRHALGKVYQTKTQRLSAALTDLFSNVSDGSLVVDLPEFSGTFEIGARSHILHRILVDGHYEPGLIDIIRKHLDSRRDVLDVGANVGLFTILISSLLKPHARVLAAEPTPGAVQYLRKNIDLNTRQNIIVFEGILAGAAGRREIHVVPGLEEYSSITALVHPSVKNHHHTSLTVASSTIDDLVTMFDLSPGFVKIDTEGAEYEVLSGALNTISTHRPIITCEAWTEKIAVGSDTSSAAISNLLAKYGYRILKPYNDQILAIPD